MALALALDPAGTGHPCRYWNIGSAHLDHRARQVTLWLHGWLSAESRRAGAHPAAAVQAVLLPEDLPAEDLHGLTTALLYTALAARAARDAADAETLQRAEGAHGAAPFAGATAC